MLNEPLNFVMDFKEIKSVGRRNFLNVKIPLIEKDIKSLNHNCLPKKWKVLPICKIKILLCNRYIEKFMWGFCKTPTWGGDATFYFPRAFMARSVSWHGGVHFFLNFGIHCFFPTKRKKRLIDTPPLLHLLFDLIQ